MNQILLGDIDSSGGLEGGRGEGEKDREIICETLQGRRHQKNYNPCTQHSEL